MFSFLKKLFAPKQPTDSVATSREDWDMFRKGLPTAQTAVASLITEIEEHEDRIRSLKYDARTCLHKAVSVLERNLEQKQERDLIETLGQRNACIQEYLLLKAQLDRYAHILAEIRPFLKHCHTMLCNSEAPFSKGYPYVVQQKIQVARDSSETMENFRKKMEKNAQERKRQEDEELSQSIIGIAFDEPCDLPQLLQKWAFWVNQGGDGARKS